jgi:hypothetical protein
VSRPTASATVARFAASVAVGWGGACDGTGLSDRGYLGAELSFGLVVDLDVGVFFAGVGRGLFDDGVVGVGFDDRVAAVDDALQMPWHDSFCHGSGAYGYDSVSGGNGG